MPCLFPFVYWYCIVELHAKLMNVGTNAADLVCVFVITVSCKFANANLIFLSTWQLNNFFGSFCGIRIWCGEKAAREF